MKTAEAKKEMSKLLRFLKPLQHADEILAVALAAEGNLSALNREASEVGGAVARQREVLEDLTGAYDALVAAYAVTEGKVAAERVLLDEAEDKAAVVRETIRRDTEALHTSYAELKEGLQGEIDALEASLADLHTEEERIDAKLAQFKALSHEQG